MSEKKLPHKASIPLSTESSRYKTRTYIENPDATASGDLTPPTVGDTFAGFKLLSVLGKGGFGTVFRAKDIKLGRKVALKVLHAKALAQPDAQEKFLAEARALAAIQNDHVVSVFQVGCEDGQLFLAMPLLGGETLAVRLEREGALPVEEVRRIGRETAAGLAAIHAKGLVHRDLKPSNIWLEAGSGRVKVLDLGLAQDSLVTSDSIAGTPSYMSPEQSEGKELDFRSDLFSLGTVLYECASGRRPFRRDTMADTLRAIREETPPAVAKANPGISGEVSTVIECLHQKNPAARPASASELESLFQSKDRPGLGTKCKSLRGAYISIAAVALIAPLFAYLIWSATRSKQSTDTQPTPVPLISEPVRVLAMDVKHYAAVDAKDVRSRGIVGKDSFGARLGDEFDFQARLSRPAYAYVIVFRPDGRAEVLYPQDEEDLPAKTETPFYPSKKRDDRYVMEEGHGLWLIALIVSDEPLPSYRAWREAHPDSPWKPATGKADQVWLDDGQIVETIIKGNAPTRSERASKSAKEKVPIIGIVDWLREQSNGTVSAVAFTVQAKK